jgi:hypothetical protein
LGERDKGESYGHGFTRNPSRASNNLKASQAGLSNCLAPALKPVSPAAYFLVKRHLICKTL